MSTRKKWLSAALLMTGSVMLSIVLYRLFVRMIIEPGAPAAMVASSLGYLVASMVCVVLGAAMWKRLTVPVAEFSLIGGAFCLGIAFRLIGDNANVLGTMGLVAFVMGYLILRTAANRGRQRRMFDRFFEKPLSPAAAALADFPTRGFHEPVYATSSLHAMRLNLGDSVRPEFDREAALRALRAS